MQVEDRRRRGQDRRDESWGGVLHVSPSPGNAHQDLRDDLLRVLDDRARGGVGGRWRSERNLARPGGWPDDYRIPDMVYLGPAARCRDMGSHYEGPPDVVVEIAGEEDTSRAKLPWYAALGVPEVWFLDVASRRPEVFVLEAGRYVRLAPDAERWVASRRFPVALRTSEKKLQVRWPGERAPHASL